MNSNDSDLPQKMRHVFLPASFLCFLLSVSSLLFTFTHQALSAKQSGLSSPHIFASGTLSLILPGLAILVFSFYKPIEKIFKGTLLVLIGLAFLVATLSILDVRLGVLSDWLIGLLYIFNMSVFSLLIWGFVNRVTTTWDGKKYYIAFALLLSFICTIPFSFKLILFETPKPSNMFLILPAIGLLILALLFFNWIWQKLPAPLLHPETLPSRIRFPFLSGAYLLSGAFVVQCFLDLIFKEKVYATHTNPADYNHFMGSYSFSAGTTALLTSLIWVVLGTWLVKKKGWKTAAICGSLSILAGGLIFLFLPLSSVAQGSFNGLLRGTSSALFFPLFQILYLYLPYQNRFKTKVVTEMIVYPLLIATPQLISTVLITFLGSVDAAAIYLKILALLLMVLLVFASKRAGSQFAT